MPGQAGSLVLGRHVEPLEVPKGVISRDQGDIHPDGNPHFMLDPLRVGELALVVADKLSSLAPGHGPFFQKRAKAFKNRMVASMKIWQAAVEKSGAQKVFTYHKTLTYFLQRLGVKTLGYIEPKPGVPPTAGHVLSLIKLAKRQKISLILLENLYEPTIPLRIKKEIQGMKVAAVPVSVGGAPGVTSLGLLYESMVKSLQK